MNNTTRKQIARGISFILTSVLMAAPAWAVGAPDLGAETARTCAGVMLIEKLSFQAPFLEEWTSVTLGDPTLIYDPNGEALFWQFPVLEYGAEVGRVAVAANALYGAAGLSVTVGALPFSIAERVEAAEHEFEAEHPGAEVLSAVPVLAHEPRIAARIEYVDPVSGDRAVEFIDLETLEPLSGGNWDAPGDPEIQSALGLMSEDRPEERRRSFWNDVADVDRIEEQLRLAEIDPQLTDPFTSGMWEAGREALELAGVHLANRHVVPVSALHYFKQLQPTWSARAVAQMIEYYHFGYTPRTQAQINQILNALGWNNTPCPGAEYPWKDALVSYYRTYPLMIYSEAVEDLTRATANDEAKQRKGMKRLLAEIDADAPFSDHVGGQWRMGMAYDIYEHQMIGTSETRYIIGIYDPDPVYGGIRWELGWTDGMLGLSYTSNAPRHLPVAVRNFQLLGSTP